MTSLRSEMYEAFRDLGAPEDKALKAATALAGCCEDVATIKSDVLLVKWMLGFVLDFQIAFAFKLFVH